jgi:hypothetical protein
MDKPNKDACFVCGGEIIDSKYGFGDIEYCQASCKDKDMIRRARENLHSEEIDFLESFD